MFRAIGSDRGCACSNPEDHYLTRSPVPTGWVRFWRRVGRHACNQLRVDPIEICDKTGLRNVDPLDHPRLLVSDVTSPTIPLSERLDPLEIFAFRTRVNPVSESNPETQSRSCLLVVKHRTPLPAAPVHNRDSVLTRQVQVPASRRDLAQGQVKGQQGPRCPSLYGLVSCLVQCRPEPAVPGQFPCWVFFELGPDGQV